MTRSRGRRCLLYLIFVRLCGRLILLGRSSAYNNLQLPVLLYEAAVLRRANAPSRLDWAGRGLRRARPAPNAEPADAPDSHGRRRSPMTPPPDKRKPLTSRTNPAREGADPARQAPHLRGCYAPLDPPRRSHELAAIGNGEQTGSRHGPGHHTHAVWKTSDLRTLTDTGTRTESLPCALVGGVCAGQRPRGADSGNTVNPCQQPLVRRASHSLPRRGWAALRAGMADMCAVRDTCTWQPSNAESAGRMWIVLPARLTRLCGGVGVGSGAWVPA
jgi:hypothetical protein